MNETPLTWHRDPSNPILPPDPESTVDQKRHRAVGHGTDGLEWTDHRVILSPRPDGPGEHAAVAAPWGWQDGEPYRMLYCGAGTATASVTS